jgi:hypothetical protein
MTTLLPTLRILLRTFFAVQLILGIVFWTGNGLQLVTLHMLVGFGFVLTLWAIGIAAAFRGGAPAMSMVAIGWGLLLLWLGASQATLLLGQWHWLIQVAHLLVGFIGMGLGERVASIAIARRATA